MRCELADGSIREVTTPADLNSLLDALGGGDHLILEGETLFMQYAPGKTGSGVLQYGDGVALYEAAGPVPGETAREALQSFLAGGGEWRQIVVWQGDTPAGSGVRSGTAGGGTASDGGAPGTRGPAGEQSLADMVKKEAVQAVKQKANRLIRQGLRRFLG